MEGGGEGQKKWTDGRVGGMDDEIMKNKMGLQLGQLAFQYFGSGPTLPTRVPYAAVIICCMFFTESGIVALGTHLYGIWYIYFFFFWPG